MLAVLLQEEGTANTTKEVAYTKNVANTSAGKAFEKQPTRYRLHL